MEVIFPSPSPSSSSSSSSSTSSSSDPMLPPLSTTTKAWSSRCVFLWLLLQLTATKTNAQWFPLYTSTASSACGDLVPTLKYYFDPAFQACQECPADQYADIENLDGDGNPWRCICKPGYQSTLNNCYGNDDGACQGLTCTDCTTNGNSTTWDRSSCLACDVGVSLDSNGYCDCPSVAGFKQVIVDQDAVGNTQLQSTCASCPSGWLRA